MELPYKKEGGSREGALLRKVLKIILINIKKLFCTYFLPNLSLEKLMHLVVFEPSERNKTD